MKASDLFVRCLEVEGIEYIFGVPGEENADFMMSLEDSPIAVRPHPARAGRGLHGRGLRSADRESGRLSRHARPRRHQPDHRRRRRQHGPRADAGAHGPGQLDAPPQGVAPGDGRGGHVQAGDQVGPGRAPPGQHPGDRAQGRAPGAHGEARRRATSSCPRTSPSSRPRRKPIEPRALPPAGPRRQDRGQGVGRRSARRKQPIILAGNGTIRKRASKQLRDFVSKTGIGVVSTFMAKGASTWTPRSASTRSGSRAATSRWLRHRAGRPGHLARLRHGRVPPAAVEPGRRQEDHPHATSSRPRSTTTTAPEVEVVGDLAPHAVDAERARGRARLRDARPRPQPHAHGAQGD